MRVSDAIKATRAKQSDGEGEPEFERSSTACRALGCPCAGSIDIGRTSRFYCSWHAWAVPSDWPRITEQLLDHKWLIDFIGELTQSHDRGQRGDWQAKADEFFRTDPHCIPSSDERTRWNLYCWRLREELAWRIGVRKERPDPRPPMFRLAPPPEPMLEAA